MLSKEFLEKIRKDLAPLKKYSVIVYGSILTKYFSDRSDIDIAIVTKKRDKETNKKIWKEMLKYSGKKYDIKVFEFLPLWLKIEIIKNHITIFGDEKELSEYFYFYWKIWKDMEYRIKENQQSSINEIREGISNLKRLKSFLWR